METPEKNESHVENRENERGIFVNVHLRAVGEALTLKKSKVRIDGLKPIAEVEKYLKKQLKYNGALFLFCGSGFSPTPDQLIQDLFQCFQSGDELAISYGYQEAWG